MVIVNGVQKVGKAGRTGFVGLPPFATFASRTLVPGPVSRRLTG